MRRPDRAPCGCRSACRAPSTSTFRMPSASRSSLSHSTKVRSSMAPLPIGTTSSSRLRVMTKPPTCCDRWRGKPSISLRERGDQPHARALRIEPRARRRHLATPRRRRRPRSRTSARRWYPRTGRRPCRPRGSPSGRDRRSRCAAMPARSRPYFRRCTGSPPRAARARNRRRCRAARRARCEMKRSNSRSPRTGSTSVMPRQIADRGIGRRAAALAEDALRCAQSARCRRR